eukprot:gb/GECG01000124.1/.p1 GENE.gb/GECG01000124.1/~~gb/GECG01000124.1/.p1  ORF type:complete len:324 (+),score=33.11 gb/GECG01000124.1/:1-972(+)
MVENTSLDALAAAGEREFLLSSSALKANNMYMPSVSRENYAFAIPSANGSSYSPTILGKRSLSGSMVNGNAPEKKGTGGRNHPSKEGVFLSFLNEQKQGNGARKQMAANEFRGTDLSISGTLVFPLSPNKIFHLAEQSPKSVEKVPDTKRIRNLSQSGNNSPSSHPNEILSGSGSSDQQIWTKIEACSYEFPYSKPPPEYLINLREVTECFRNWLRRKLRTWMMDHWPFPYPGTLTLSRLSKETGLSTKQLEDWFRNQRRRHWRPYMAENYPDALQYAERVRGNREEGGIPALPRHSLDFYVETARIALKRWNGYTYPSGNLN